jgi:hypothetical protein
MTPVEVVLAHRWKSYDKDGRFRCRAGCVIDVENRPMLLSRTQTSDLEAHHQVDMLTEAGFLGEAG